jgi:hypothetical protein
MQIDMTDGSQCYMNMPGDGSDLCPLCCGLLCRFQQLLLFVLSQPAGNEATW